MTTATKPDSGERHLPSSTNTRASRADVRLLAALAATVFAPALATGCRQHAKADHLDASAAASAQPSHPSGRQTEMHRVFIANHGKLVGAMNGFAWVAGGAGTFFDTPNPCDARRCFKGTDNELCAVGSIRPLRCLPDGSPASSCDSESNWGAQIGLDANPAAGPWGPDAPAAVSIEYSDDRSGRHQLTAHRAGDPQRREYCVDDYHSGDLVTADRFTLRSGDSHDALSDFACVDKLGLKVISTKQSTSFDLCITGIFVSKEGVREDVATSDAR
jgi:hypothetical protein